MTTLMTHEQIDAGEVIDRYIRGDLDPGTREAFEAHYFACDRCFAALQESERLRGAVHEHVARGQLHATPGSTVRWEWLALAATVLLAAGLAWTLAYRIPRLERELADARAVQAARDVPARGASEAPVQAARRPEPNVAMVLLRAERDMARVPEVTVPVGAAHFIVMIDAPVGVNEARLQIAREDGPEIASVPGLVANPSGAYVVSLPAAAFESGVYRLRLFTTREPSSLVLVGEFLLKVDRR